MMKRMNSYLIFTKCYPIYLINAVMLHLYNKLIWVHKERRILHKREVPTFDMAVFPKKI